MAVFGSGDSTFSASDYADVGTPAAGSEGPSFLSDPFYGGDGGAAASASSSGAMPGTGLSPTAVGQDLSTIFGGGGAAGGFVSPFGTTAPAPGPGTSLALFGHPRGTHLNKTAYYRKVMGVPVRVPKGTVNVANRRRNAGNAKAVKRALGRIAMFDHLARRVESEMARVARRSHRPARAACAPSGKRGHRAGCRCFACRR